MSRRVTLTDEFQFRSGGMAEASLLNIFFTSRFYSNVIYEFINYFDVHKDE